MPVNITISHETPEGVIQHVKALAASFDHRPTAAPSGPAPSIVQTATEAAAIVASAKTADEPARRGRKSNAQKAAEAAQQISAQPENRVDPEVDTQDEADEAAESGDEDVFGASSPARTLDDIRKLASDYVTKYGMPAAQEDGKKVLSSVAGVSRINEIPVEKVSAAFEAMEKALNENPYKRAVVGL